jgi:hypothetical protein
MKTLLDLFESGALVQSVIAIVLVITVSVLALSDRAIPPTIENTLLLVLGFYFGAKIQNAVNTIRRANLVRYDE